MRLRSLRTIYRSARMRVRLSPQRPMTCRGKRRALAATLRTPARKSLNDSRIAVLRRNSRLTAPGATATLNAISMESGAAAALAAGKDIAEH
jgi:hypothetical protein